MNEDKIRKALKDFNANPADRAAQEVLQRQLGVYAVIARQPDGRLRAPRSPAPTAAR